MAAVTAAEVAAYIDGVVFALELLKKISGINNLSLLSGGGLKSKLRGLFCKQKCEGQSHRYTKETIKSRTDPTAIAKKLSCAMRVNT
jgi:hypothetical protein